MTSPTRTNSSRNKRSRPAHLTIRQKFRLLRSRRARAWVTKSPTLTNSTSVGVVSSPRRRWILKKQSPRARKGRIQRFLSKELRQNKRQGPPSELEDLIDTCRDTAESMGLYRRQSTILSDYGNLRAEEVGWVPPPDPPSSEDFKDPEDPPSPLSESSPSQSSYNGKGKGKAVVREDDKPQRFGSLNQLATFSFEDLSSTQEYGEAGPSSSQRRRSFHSYRPLDSSSASSSSSAPSIRKVTWSPDLPTRASLERNSTAIEEDKDGTASHTLSLSPIPDLHLDTSFLGKPGSSAVVVDGCDPSKTGGDRESVRVDSVGGAEESRAIVTSSSSSDNRPVWTENLGQFSNTHELHRDDQQRVAEAPLMTGIGQALTEDVHDDSSVWTERPRGIYNAGDSADTFTSSGEPSASSPVHSIPALVDAVLGPPLILKATNSYDIRPQAYQAKLPLKKTGGKRKKARKQVSAFIHFWGFGPKPVSSSDSSDEDMVPMDRHPPLFYVPELPDMQHGDDEAERNLNSLTMHLHRTMSDTEKDLYLNGGGEIPPPTPKLRTALPDLTRVVPSSTRPKRRASTLDKFKQRMPKVSYMLHRIEEEQPSSTGVASRPSAQEQVTVSVREVDEEDEQEEDNLKNEGAGEEGHKARGQENTMQVFAVHDIQYHLPAPFQAIEKFFHRKLRGTKDDQPAHTKVEEICPLGKLPFEEVEDCFLKKPSITKESASADYRMLKLLALAQRVYKELIDIDIWVAKFLIQLQEVTEQYCGDVPPEALPTEGTMAMFYEMFIDSIVVACNALKSRSIEIVDEWAWLESFIDRARRWRAEQAEDERLRDFFRDLQTPIHELYCCESSSATRVGSETSDEKQISECASSSLDVERGTINLAASTQGDADDAWSTITDVEVGPTAVEPTDVDDSLAQVAAWLRFGATTHSNV